MYSSTPSHASSHAPRFRAALYPRIKHCSQCAFHQGNAPILELCLNDLGQRLADIKRDFEQIIISTACIPDSLIDQMTGIYPNAEISVVTTLDEHKQLIPHQADLVISFLHLQWIDDIETYLFILRHALKPDGACLISSLGENSLHNLQQHLMTEDIKYYDGAYQRIAPRIPLKGLAALLQISGFALPVADKETFAMPQSDALSLLHNLRQQGLGFNMLQDVAPMISKSVYYHLRETMLSEDIDILHGIGWAPAASQPQPLTPGSAQSNLAEALNTTAHDLNEVAIPEKKRQD